jgi:acetoin utilization deacetylase AcuC-like enzyme
MKQVGIFYYKWQHKHKTPKNHPESPKRVKKIVKEIKKFFKDRKEIIFKDMPKADLSKVLGVHEIQYVNYIKNFCLKGGGWIDYDTYFTKNSLDVALHSVGGVLEAYKLVLNREISSAFVLTRPPGHHAGKRGVALNADSLGFCMFNNVAIAAHQLINKEKIKRITIIDLDSHHGNGTQEIFFNTPLVLYISLHQNENFYPWSGSIEEIGEGDGEGFNINIPLSKYSGNIEYITAFKKIIEPVIDNYNPEFIIVSLGFDAHKDDPYSDLKLTTNGYLTLLYHIKKLSDKYCNGRLMLCLEGGYNTDVLRKISVKLIELLINKRKFIFIKNFKKKKISNNFMKNIEELKKILSFYWSI